VSEPDKSPEPQSGMKAVTAENFDFMAAVGGVRGLIEATAPSLLFIIVFTIRDSMREAIIAAVVTAVVLLGVRLIQRIDITPALGGLAGVLISAIWASRTGEPGDYFVWGLWTNGIYLALCVISIVITWPAIGVLVSILRGEDQSWRTNPDRTSLRRRYYVATWLWAGVFGLRLLVQLPLYLSDQVEALGIARLLMGPFLFGAALWVTWMLVRRPSETLRPDRSPDRSA